MVTKEQDIWETWDTYKLIPGTKDGAFERFRNSKAFQKKIADAKKTLSKGRFIEGVASSLTKTEIAEEFFTNAK